MTEKEIHEIIAPGGVLRNIDIGCKILHQKFEEERENYQEEHTVCVSEAYINGTVSERQALIDSNNKTEYYRQLLISINTMSAIIGTKE